MIFQILFLMLLPKALSYTCTLPYSGHPAYCLPSVRIDSGLIVGNYQFSRTGKIYNAFTSIPYAKPPVGHLRFAAPEEPDPWAYFLLATGKAPLCIQRNYLFSDKPVIEGQEDCLYLNVYVPNIHNDINSGNMYKNNNVDALKPVLVYIHWGGFIAGSGNEDYFDPSYFMDKNIVLVTFNYRLGPFGFLTTLDDEAPGNYALKDQVLALKWVQKNIGSFNGDKDRVTIAGQSAGAGSTHLHMLSPASKGLFHQAISQSGNALAAWAFLNSEAQKTVTGYQASFVGCGNSTTPTRQLVNCLRTVSASDILQSQDYFKTFYADPLVIFTSAIETRSARNPNPFLTKPPVEYLVDGTFQKVPWMTGLVKNEGDIKAQGLIRNSKIRKDLNANFQNILSNSLLALSLSTQDVEGLYKNISQFYFDSGNTINANNPDSVQGLVDVYTDRVFSYALYQSLYLQSLQGHYPVYMYSFEYEGEFTYGDYFAGSATEQICFDWGASHCDDMLYLFKTPALFPNLTSQNDIALSNKMVDLWTNFVTYGNPNPAQHSVLPPDVDWRPLYINRSTYREMGDRITFLNITGSFGYGFKFAIASGFFKERTKFWIDSDIYENRYTNNGQ
ncbi:venom carboxylesterase-6-like [Sitophilus oryzae]|uniref:Venom carboxylesterase-6-like n=1 Tax=Sitophilus oryzae TaxID=7048 RepID=A0A6J2XPT1_SITOR|nr:venom carboxylesterase-6-like [Sitophilus oryzae]XP_030753382.1 venom carboxylesterase-6-like [Sitophilus oryzae]XP_030753383.1 venom carboxylesterase-6-like [Sitophilus oryzae]XP_030753385.1 venom carboxylesterase-6-like [Sitophilus oryzae]